MIKLGIIAALILLAILSCSQNGDLAVPKTAKEPGLLYPLKPVNTIKIYSDHEIDSIQYAYNKLINEVKAQRDIFYNDYMNAINDTARFELVRSARKYLIRIISNELLPKWYGTNWEFEGHTNIPLEGAVACGYFVSTPLKHIGFNLNRYKMAQKYSHDIIKTLCDSNQIMIFSKEILGEKLIEISNKEDDIYIVGLDCHVGFVINTDNKLKFVHSNYMSPVKVVEEDVYESEAFIQSDMYVLGSLFGFDEFTKKWIINDEIQ